MGAMHSSVMHDAFSAFHIVLLKIIRYAVSSGKSKFAVSINIRDGIYSLHMNCCSSKRNEL